MTSYIERMEEHVRQSKESMLIARDARKHLISLAKEISSLSTELGESLTNAPGKDASLPEWLRFFGESLAASRKLSKSTTALSHRAACAVLLLARDAKFRERSKIVGEVKSHLGLGDSTIQQVSALVNGFPLTARAVSERGFPLSVYRRMASVTNAWRQSFEDDNKLSFEDLVKWVDEFVSQRENAPTQNDITKNLRLVFSVGETHESKVKSAKETSQAHKWADLVANNSRKLSEVPASIQAHTDKLVEEKLAEKGITTISQGSRLYPIWLALKNDSPNANVVSIAISSAKQILADLQEIQKQLALTAYQEKRAELAEMAEELGIEVDAPSWGNLDVRIVSALERAKLTPDKVQQMSQRELKEIDGIGNKSAERIVTQFTN